MIDDMEILIEELQSGSKRIKKIIEDLKEFAQHGDRHVEKQFNLKETVIKSVSIVNKSIQKKNVNLILDIQPDIPLMAGDSLKIEQVLINLLLNAAHAIDDKANCFIKLICRTRGDDIIRLVVADNGCGIKKKDLGRIFDPFFSTNMDSGGTGLGLSVSFGIIKEHNGQVYVISNKGSGTVFILDFPVDRQCSAPVIIPGVILIDDGSPGMGKIDIALEKNHMYHTKIMSDRGNIVKEITGRYDTDIVILNLGHTALEMVKLFNLNLPWVKIIGITAEPGSPELEDELYNSGVVKIVRHSENTADTIIQEIAVLR